MSLLPSSLIDIAWLRASMRLNPRLAFGRPMHAAAMAHRPLAESTVFDTSLYARRKNAQRAMAPAGVRIQNSETSLLEQRVEEFRSLVGAEDPAETSLSGTYQPTFSELELLDVYQDLLDTLPIQSSSVPIPEPDKAQGDNAAMYNLATRILPSPSEGVALEEPVQQTDNPKYAHPLQTLATSHQRILTRLVELIGEAGSPEALSSQAILPSADEWASLIRVSIHAGDAGYAEQALALMNECGLPSEAVNEQVTALLAHYAKNGAVEKAENIISNFIAGAPNEIQRHLHVKAHLRATSPKTIPLSALTVLHEYENKGLAAPLKTYNNLISTLFSVPRSIAKAQAWDLFAHMRYVAHSDPDAVLYATMIKACAYAPASGGIGVAEPERALDLWTEMTVDKRIAPTRDAYNAVILACARSGERKFVNEAFRLAREMLDGYRDSRGVSGFRPNGALFAALLEGAKRIGDLGRVRWILAEMVKAVVDGREGMEADDTMLTEWVMVHVFHAYAAYEAPFRREQTLAAKEVDPDFEPALQAKQEMEPELEQQDSRVTESDDDASFASLPPQTRSAVLAEAANLFEGIVQDNAAEAGTDDVPRIFANVPLTAPVLNAYIAVQYAHAPFPAATELWKTLFDAHGVSRNVYSFVDALEACAGVSKASRPHALLFARYVWAKWEQFVRAHPEGLPPRAVERAHVAVIRVYALTNELGLAIDALRAFTAAYPAHTLAKPASATKAPLRSTRTVLATAATPRPLVRFTSATDVGDESVPPFVRFADVELLHHRLIAAGRHKDIKYVQWVCNCYSAALRGRREATLKQGVAGYAT